MGKKPFRTAITEADIGTLVCELLGEYAGGVMNTGDCSGCQCGNDRTRMLSHSGDDSVVRGHCVGWIITEPVGLTREDGGGIGSTPPCFDGAQPILLVALEIMA